LAARARARGASLGAALLSSHPDALALQREDRTAQQHRSALRATVAELTNTRSRNRCGVLAKLRVAVHLDDEREIRALVRSAILDLRSQPGD
jgi:hypothetical protein